MDLGVGEVEAPGPVHAKEHTTSDALEGWSSEDEDGKEDSGMEEGAEEGAEESAEESAEEGDESDQSDEEM